MPLSEEEQRVLDQLERDLGADPALGRAMSASAPHRGRVVVGVLGVIAGLGIMIVGAIMNVVPLGIAGFALMIVSALWVLISPAPRPGAAGRGPRAVPSGRKPAGRGPKQPFLRRVEDRLARRRERGEF